MTSSPAHIPVPSPVPFNRLFLPTKGVRFMTTKLWFQAVVAATAVALALFTAPASAGTLATWSGGGGSGSWATASNWNPAVNVPTTTGTFSLVFGGTNRTTTVNNVGTVSIDSMSFTNNGSSGQNALFTITGGTLNLVSASISTTTASGSPFGTTTSDGDTIASELVLFGTSSIITSGSHNLSLTGNITGGGAVVFDDSTPGSNETVFLAGSNSYSGGTLIRGGFVQTSVRGTLSASNNAALGSGAVTISDNGTLLVRNSSVISNSLTVSGSGNIGNSLTGSFGVAGATADYAGPITVAGDTRFSSTSSVNGDSTSKFLISGPIDLGANRLTLRSQTATGATGGLLIQITGTISGSGGIDIVGQQATGRVRIDNANNYTGGTTITTGTLIVGNASALGTGFLAVNTNGLDLNGQALSVGALSGSSSGVIQSSVAGPASLTTTAATDSTYAGTIINGNGSAVVGLTKAGGGKLTLTGSNSYTGVTNVNGGVLALGGANVLAGGGDIGFGGGTLQYSAVNTLDYSARIKNSTAAISIDTNAQDVTFATSLAATNVGGLTKTGSGTLFLNAVNAYTGPTAVNAGTLGGNGTIVGSLTVNNGATLSPGATALATDIFTVGSLALNTGATTRLTITGTTPGTQFDQVAFSGASKSVNWGGLLDLSLSGSYANYTSFSLFDGFTSQTGDLSGISFSAPGSPYSLLSFLGPIGGLWTTGTAANGQYLEFNQASGVLTIVPEPSVMALAGIGIAMGCWRGLGRRRSGRRDPSANHGG